MCVNKLILGDNLEVMKTMGDETVDLIYLDPPFFSNRDYEVIWGDDGEKRSFEDRFAGGIDHYIHWLKLRVREMHRVLKPTGSIFLHCDWHADAYIRVHILDAVFGRNNYINSIIWYYYNKLQGNINKLASNHDTVFWYSKSSKFIFNKQREKRDEVVKQIKRVWDKEKSKIINAKDESGKVQYIETDEKTLDDVWRISMLQPADRKERIGYPTQKPEKLLERIISMASNEGDIVLDPFVGGGTTIAVANRLNRKWIGIDQSVMAIKVTDLRLQKRQNELFSVPYEVIIPTYDFEKLTKEDGKDFEIFIVEKFGAIPNLKGGKDYGIDGHTHYGTPIQVKKWKKPVGRATLDEFLTAIQRDDRYLFERNKKEGQVCGFIVGFEFSKDIINEVAKLKNTENTIIELKYIRDIIPYENPPKVTLTSEELENYKYKFEARSESKSGIDFYSWDFSHDDEAFKADVIMDKEGVQEKKFQEGEHNVAVKAVDKRGLSGMDKVKIKVKDKKKK
jgi:site-specific DNA-methyltransferase (adenine-specific)